MKNKKLENLFLEYMTDLSSENIDIQLKEDEQMWLLFSEDDLHINRKNNTLYVKPVDVLMENIFNEDKVLEGQVDWVAYKKNALTLEHQISVGLGNPFTSNALTSFMGNKRVVKAIPYQYAKKMHKKDKSK